MEDKKLDCIEEEVKEVELDSAEKLEEAQPEIAEGAVEEAQPETAEEAAEEAQPEAIEEAAEEAQPETAEEAAEEAQPEAIEEAVEEAQPEAAEEAIEDVQRDYTGEVVKEIQIDQDFADEQAKKRRMREIWDKVTTGIFIALLASPVMILLYIFLWFISVS